MTPTDHKWHHAFPSCALSLHATHPAPLQVSKYQEQSQLLDPLLEGLVQPLAALLRTAAAEPAAADLGVVRGVSRLLWQLSVVRCALLTHSHGRLIVACGVECMDQDLNTLPCNVHPC